MKRHYSDFLEAYVSEIAPKGEAPERFHFWSAVSTVGGALRRRVYIDAGNFRWFPNFYIILVAPPAVGKKSTVINIGARLLREVPGVNVGADVSTWQAFVESVAKAKDFLAEGGRVDDVEDIAASLLSQTHVVTSAISLQISELGTFLDTNDNMMVNVITELYDGKLDQKFTKLTKTQGADEIMNPFVNIIAGTTPAWMNDNFRSKVGGWGLSSRCIFIHADRADRHIAYPHMLWQDKADPIFRRLTDDLRAIATLSGSYTLTPDAIAYGCGWYESHSNRVEMLNSHPHRDMWLSYFLARKWDHINKLAIVHAASRREELVITLQDLQDSVRRCEAIELEMSKVFQSKESASEEAKTRQDVWNGLCSQIRQHGPQEIWRVTGFCSNFMSGGKATEFLKQLCDSRFLCIVEGPAYDLGEAAVVDESKMPPQARPTSDRDTPPPQARPSYPPIEPDYMEELKAQIDREMEGY